MSAPEKPRSEAPYDHRYHAGNVGDVLKHTVLVAALRGLAALPRPVHVLDTHAAGGRYRLKPTGEWTAGIGRLDAGLPEDAPPAVRDYTAAVAWPRRPDHGGGYPGSPSLIRKALRPGDHLTCVELMEEPRRELEALFKDDDQVTVRGGDGLSALVEAATVRAPAGLFGLVDPAYAGKNEWGEVADALTACWMARPDVRLMLWYPIKSASRPNALKAQLREAGVPATAIELCSIPLHLDTKRRKALNGSGVILVQPPPGVLPRVAAALPTLGERLAAKGAYTSSVEAWGGAE
ncbi:MAG: 23S rRNA (adenine(2030)-N(6))-methyltransferase RlmJ [Myxococcales bacterium]|nr:23S rRNA (adenine(2030)-N(6))-methyltransferase RlmJ [Myxococcales bacterium]MCB9522784.1 23S rRNA (adenine(2030)-N(6))-methyltransferase RlmJ [Myxococcales bacterium]